VSFNNCKLEIFSKKIPKMVNINGGEFKKEKLEKEIFHIPMN